MKHPKILLNGLQIKNLKKARKLSRALSIIEEECGIKEVTIEFKNLFICPWIELDKLNKTKMEILVRNLLKKLQ